MKLCDCLTATVRVRQLKKRMLRKGRDHLMWVLLQFISGSIQKNMVSGSWSTHTHTHAPVPDMCRCQLLHLGCHGGERKIHRNVAILHSEPDPNLKPEHIVPYIACARCLCGWRRTVLLREYPRLVLGVERCRVTVKV